MANQKISALPAFNFSTGLLIPVVDTTQSGGQNGSLLASTLSDAIGLKTISVSTLDLSVPNGVRGDTTNILAYQLTDPTDTNNAILLSVEISVKTNIGTNFNYAIYNGNPASGGSLIVQNDAPIMTTSNGYMIAGEMGKITQSTDYKNSATGFILNSQLRNGIYIQITDLVSSGFPFDIAFNFLLIPAGDAASLPVYSPTTTTYTGPSGLTTVDVGPGQTFAEMADAMPYVAPGFTMTVHPGTYYKPFVVPTGFDGFTIQAATGASADTVKCNGRGGYYTGLMYDYAAWTGNTSYSGSGPKNPFRLAQGKGFILIQCGGTVSGLGFLDCGGGYTYDLREQGRPTSYDPNQPPVVIDGVSVHEQQGGEAGIYIINQNSGTSTFTTTISRCMFDGGCNGIFTPSFGNGTTTGNQVGNFTLNIDHCDFSTNLPCGNSDGGMAHNVYISNLYVNVTNTNFYGCYANSFKSRSPHITADNCFFESWWGRCIDSPETGTLVVNNSTFTQKFIAGQHPAIGNFIGLSDEQVYGDHGHILIGGMVPAQFNNCTVNIGRYDTMFLLLYGQTAVFTNPTQTMYIGPNAAGMTDTPSLIYDIADGSSTNGVTGLCFFAVGNDGVIGVYDPTKNPPNYAPATINLGNMPPRRATMHNTP